MSRPRTPWLPIAVLAAALGGLFAGGCTTNQWLAKYDEEQLLAESPPRSVYPTAVPIEEAELELAKRPHPAAPTESQTAHKPIGQSTDKPANAEKPTAQDAPPRPSAPPAASMAVVPPALRPQAARPENEAAKPPTTEPSGSSQTSTAEPTESISAVSASQLALPGSTAAAEANSPQPETSATTNIVAGAAATAPAEMSLEERLAAIESQRNVLIAMLEEELRLSTGVSLEEAARQRLEQELRLLYAVAGRDDDAVAAIDALPASEREAYKHLVFGLTHWLAEEQPRRAPLKNARVMRSLRAATTAIAPASKLEIQKLAFCERVDSFGGYTEFPRSEFLPGQQAILYAEIDNFTAIEKGPQSFETELQGSYQIFDAGGDIVAERQLPLDRQACRRYRRDYFLAYRIFLPQQIAPGRYRLELTIEDLKAADSFQGRKLGEGTIEFTIRN